GTHCSTEELATPGWKNNPHASGIWVGHSPAMLDLDLEAHGLNLMFPRFSRAQPFLDGTAFVPDLYDANRFYKKVQRFSAKDADTFRDIYNRFVDVRRELLEVWVYDPPSQANWDRTIELLRSIPHVPEDFDTMTGFELIDLLFENDHFKAQLAGWSHAVALEPHAPVIGAIGAILLVSAFGVQQSIGGSHQIPHALFRSIVRDGGKVLQNCEVAEIILEDGTATGVRLGEHASYPERVIKARKAVISNLSPVPTFLHLIGADHLEADWTRQLQDYNYWGVLFTAAFLAKAPPHWVGTDWDPDIENAWHFNFGADTLDDVRKMTDAVLNDRIPDPITFLAANFNFTMHDPKASPPGLWNIQLWADVPGALPDGGLDAWDDLTEDVLQRSEDRLEEYAPGFRTGIVDRVGYSPADVARRNTSAINGVWSAGIVEPGQMYMDRPFDGCGAPRTPFKNLYLSNGVWPHSFSWLGAGHNAALVILEDLGLKRPDWWSHRALEWFDVYAKRNDLAIAPKVTV
ncbi:MAG: phytoene desaturase family protein, partial [Thermoplasmata archaeon]